MHSHRLKSDGEHNKIGASERHEEISNKDHPRASWKIMFFKGYKKLEIKKRSSTIMCEAESQKIKLKKAISIDAVLFSFRTRVLVGLKPPWLQRHKILVILIMGHTKMQKFGM